MNISHFFNEDASVLQQAFGQQLQNHFNLLTQAVPGIKEIQWTSSQEDENVYMMTQFELTKHNGYKYHHKDRSISGMEFTEEEFFLLNEFIEYLQDSSRALVVVFGNFTFSLTSE